VAFTSWRQGALGRFMRAASVHGPAIAFESFIVWVMLETFQFLGYGGQPGGHQGPAFYVPMTMVLAGAAMGAGEARFKLYRRVWTVAGLSDAIAIGAAVTEAALLITVANALMPDGARAYRLLVPVLATPAMVIGVGLFRLLPRLFSRIRASSNRLLMVVQDGNGYAAIKSLAQHPNVEWKPVGIVTWKSGEEDMTVMGIPVLGHVSDLARFIRITQADGVGFVLDDSTPIAEQRDLIATCLAAHRPIFIVPASLQWFARQPTTPLRLLSADDLVGRTPRDIELDEIADLVKNRSVMVTGAAGSIGSELCRVIAKLGPSRLVMLDDNESGLFDITEELQADVRFDLRSALVSIVDNPAVLGVFADERPDIVFHAAAYKHVPLLERHPIQAFRTNVIGTRNVLRAAGAARSSTFVLVSTDKAVARHSVMGCTKRLCELMVLAHRDEMQCWAVRFGNVVGSRGSVVPLFEKQIEHGGPVTITHPETTRYMMTIREAVMLVIASLRIGTSRRLYMLDMGEPIRIAALAEDLIRSRGLRPGADIEVVYTGLREGERLTEELLAADEGIRTTANPAIREVISSSALSQSDLDWTIDHLARLADDARASELVAGLKRVVRDSVRFEPVEEQRPRRPGVTEERKESA
jgi:FlaA1/EpsC-like NDP-sugar epimerase